MDGDKKDQFLYEEIKEVGVAVSKLNDKLAELDKSVSEHKLVFDIHAKTDERMYEELKRMNDILEVNTASLKEHMAQTALLKATVLQMDARLLPMELEKIRRDAINAWLKDKLILAAKGAGVLLGSGGIVWSILKYLGH